MLIHDLRELFKVRVTGMVLVTGWAGFYLGSMQSGISSVQRGLLDTLIGIGLVSAGAGALNQALERSSDALMIRTADRPLPTGRISLTQGIAAGIGSLAIGAWWLLLHTNLLTVSLALLTAFTYVAVYTPLKRVTEHGDVYRGVSGGYGSAAAAGPLPADGSSGPPWRFSPFFLCGSFPTSWPLRGFIAMITPARTSACCRLCSRTGCPQWSKRCFTPC